jgi:hypothetical protein
VNLSNLAPEIKDKVQSVNTHEEICFDIF